MQCVAEIAVRLGEIRIGGYRLPLRVGGLFVVFQLIERDTEITQGRRHFRLDRRARAAPASTASLRSASEPEHFAEIGVKQRNAWRKLGRALHVFDRLAELAILVCDDARADAPLRAGSAAPRARAGKLSSASSKPAFAAAALSISERFAERHEGRGLLLGDLVHPVSITRVEISRLFAGLTYAPKPMSFLVRCVDPQARAAGTGANGAQRNFCQRSGTIGPTGVDARSFDKALRFG